MTGHKRVGEEGEQSGAGVLSLCALEIKVQQERQRYNTVNVQHYISASCSMSALSWPRLEILPFPRRQGGPSRSPYSVLEHMPAYRLYV